MTLPVAFLAVKLTLAVILASGGALAIWYGYKLFSTKAGSARDQTVIECGTLKIHTSSVGATVMLTAVAWAWLATSVVPKSLHSDGDKVDLASKGSPFPSAGEFLVSTGSGAGTQFLSCRKNNADFVCYSLKPGEKCGAAPPIRNGLARLQVSAVPGSGSVVDGTAANQERQLRQVLAERAERDWALRVMNYSGKDKAGAVRRVVFNNVATELEKPMCAWLACEGWTFGPCGVLPDVDDSAP